MKRKSLILAWGIAVLYMANLTFAGQQDKSVSNLLNSALAEFRAGNYLKAIDGFSQVLKTHPNDKDAWFLTAISYQRLGKYDRELATYDDLLKIDPTNSVAISNRAVALFRLNKYEEMFISFKKAKSFDPNDGHIFLNSGNCLLDLGRYGEAHADFSKAAELGKPSKYLTWTKRLLRQINGIDLPPKKWRPNTADYHTDISLTKQGGPLIDMPERKDVPAATGGGLTSLVGFSGTRLSFDGTPNNPFEYAPGFYVWSGAVINDSKYGVLLENGTHFRHEMWRGEEKIKRNGRIKDWKCEFLNHH